LHSFKMKAKQMKKNILVFLFILSTVYACSQSFGTVSAPAATSNSTSGNYSFTELYAENGKPLSTANKEIGGSPFLNENWGKGEVWLQNGFRLKNLELQLDADKNELHFRKNNIAYKFVDSLKEFSMEFKDGELTQYVLFRSGYPPIEKKSIMAFYQVVADGKKVQLLKYLSKEIREKYKYGSPVTKEYQLAVHYYIYDVSTGTIKAVNPGKESLIKTMPLYEKNISLFSKLKKYKLKSENEMKELVIAVNE
jgi:hypothetical protein